LHGTIIGVDGHWVTVIEYVAEVRFAFAALHTVLAPIQGAEEAHAGIRNDEGRRAVAIAEELADLEQNLGRRVHDVREVVRHQRVGKLEVGGAEEL